MNAITIAAASLLLLQSTAPQKPAAPPAKPTAAPQKAAGPAPKIGATDLPVTVSYKGKGAVDATHKIVVWLFSDPNITSNSRPITHQIVSKNNEMITFKDVTTSPVYLFAVYDEKGNYDGVSGPPPAGIPSSPYRKVAKGPAAPVKPGAPIRFVFDDSERWNK